MGQLTLIILPISSWALRSQWNLANVHDSTVAKCGDHYYICQTDALGKCVGWTIVMPERYTAVPETIITEQSLVGTWEQIVMEYQYQTMATSFSNILSADKKEIGITTGKWSYDSTNGILTIYGFNFIVNNAWDWKASHRKATLSFHGNTSIGRSVWAKKML